MELKDLFPSEGSRKDRKRIGRGHGSGQGKTAGKGHKGQNARSGGGVKAGFEGGQMPLQRRLPKRGFNNIFAKKVANVNVCDLEVFENGTEITSALLINNGFIKRNFDVLKIIGNGSLSKILTVKANRFSKSAKEKIELAGGKVEVL